MGQEPSTRSAPAGIAGPTCRRAASPPGRPRERSITSLNSRRVPRQVVGDLGDRLTCHHPRAPESNLTSYARLHALQLPSNPSEPATKRTLSQQPAHVILTAVLALQSRHWVRVSAGGKGTSVRSLSTGTYGARASTTITSLNLTLSEGPLRVTGNHDPASPLHP